MFERFRKRLGATTQNATSTKSVMPYRASTGISTFDFYKGLSYDNAYPSIKAIANTFAEIRPYTINEKEEEQDTAVIRAIYRPNMNMSGVEFREALAVMTLVHRKTYILVWHYENGNAVPGGRGLTKDNIAGFTFLEATETNVGGRKTYRDMLTNTTWTTQDVMEITSGVDPYDISAGYSPSVSARKWSNIDDYIAAYQAGFFENGAVPAGQFIITAPSAEAFRDIVAIMQHAHRGSGRNNAPMYIHRPVDPATGAAQQSQIEWVPITADNKSLSLKEIFEQANDKIDSAFGVPASIRGVSDNNNYASSAVDERHFLRFTVRPFATKIWGRFTHELNRLTGGLDVAITFDLDIPAVADEDKVYAETKQIELNSIITGLQAGIAPETLVELLDLDIEADKLKIAPVAAPSSTTEEKALEHHHTEACTCSPFTSAKALTATQTKHVEAVAGELRKFTEAQIENVIAAGDAQPESKKKDVIRDEDGNLVDTETGEIMPDYEAMYNASQPSDETIAQDAKVLAGILFAYMIISGQKQYKDGKKLIKDTGKADLATGYDDVTDTTKTSYEAFLQNTLANFMNDNSVEIRRILSEAAAEGLSKESLATKLRGIMDTDEWRVQRFARTEEHRATSLANLDSMLNLQNQCGVKIYKTWKAHSTACPYCAEMSGNKEAVDAPFLAVGQSIKDADGGQFVNTFQDIEAADLHPNCQCYLQYTLE